MGKKITEVRNKSKEGGESFKKGAEQGRKAVSDVKQMKRLIDSLPTDVDDEIVSAAKAVEQGTKGDAEHYMQSEVGSKIEKKIIIKESGKKSMEASSKQASEQVKNNERVQQVFQQMDGVGAFGKNARSEGRGKVEKSTAEFNKAIQENQENTRKADEEFKKNLSDISSTF